MTALAVTVTNAASKHSAAQAAAPCACVPPARVAVAALGAHPVLRLVHWRRAAAATTSAHLVHAAAAAWPAGGHLALANGAFAVNTAARNVVLLHQALLHRHLVVKRYKPKAAAGAVGAAQHRGLLRQGGVEVGQEEGLECICWACFEFAAAAA